MIGSIELAHRLDPVLMAEAAGYHLDTWQESVLLSRAHKLLLLCSRQAGKSTVAALLATWVARFNRNAQILCLAPTLRQSEELLRTIRSIWQALPDTGVVARADTLTRLEASNGSRILALPGSKGDGIRGLSSIDLMIVDEASRVLSELFAAARPMLAVSGGRLVMLTTPAGRRGGFFEEWEHGEGYERFLVKAEQCKRISREFLDSERRALGPLAYAREYECSFDDDELSVFPEELIQRCITTKETSWAQKIPPPTWAQSSLSPA